MDECSRLVLEPRGWTQPVEHNIRMIGEKSAAYKIMHTNSASRASRAYTVMMYLGIVIGPMAGLLSGIGATLNPEAPITFPILSASFGFLSGLVVGIVKFAGWEEQCVAHKRAAAQYISLESNVRRQMAIPKESRLSPVQYLEYVGKAFDDLFQASPLIPRSIFQKYVIHAKQNQLTVPDEYALEIQSAKKTVSSTETIITVNDGIDRKGSVDDEYNDKKMQYELARMNGFKTILE